MANKVQTAELLREGIAGYTGVCQRARAMERGRVLRKSWVRLSYDIEGNAASSLQDQEDAPWDLWGGSAILLVAGVYEFEPFCIHADSSASAFTNVIVAADA